ncbi:MAG: DUF4118 domain-containing protein [Betaproteobacteria bacterium]|nr:DUF4118 domain-containing protein [Betaproteobacteria bacterium]
MRPYAWSLAGVLVAWALSTFTQDYFALANIVMLFLLAVVASAYWLGRGPAVFSAVIGVAVFDFFFVPPKLSFAVADAQYLVTFAVMLLTGLAITGLATGLRRAGEDAQRRERRAIDLYALAQALSGAPSHAFVLEAARDYFERSHHAHIALLLPDAAGALEVVRAAPGSSGGPATPAWDVNVARAVFGMAADARGARPAIESGGCLYLALSAPLCTRGVMVVMRGTAAPEDPGAEPDFATAAALLALALERVHLVDVAHRATLHMENERLRNTLLAALSHDLRTPLTAILGSADALRLQGADLGAERLALADAIATEARRTVDLVENILDMARLESGALAPDRQWHSLEEIAGAAVAARASMLCGRAVSVAFAADFPLVSCDAVLIERVLVNLVENAARFSPADGAIGIEGTVHEDQAVIAVRDRGPGIPEGQEEAIFGKFVRGVPNETVPGLGLGLAICRAIVEAHGGRIRAQRRAGGGTTMTFTLPIGSAPAPMAPGEDSA